MTYTIPNQTSSFVWLHRKQGKREREEKRITAKPQNLHPMNPTNKILGLSKTWVSILGKRKEAFILSETEQKVREKG